MKKLYCNGKKGFCSHCDGEKEPVCHSFNCEFIDNSGCEYIEIPNTNYDRIRSMSVDEMAKFLATHIGHYEAPYKVKDIYKNAIDEKKGKGIIWIDAFKLWLESEVDD